MPANTTFGTLNIGKDVVLDLVNSNGQTIAVNITNGFTAKQDAKVIDSKGLDGINRVAAIPDTWSGDFSLDRSGSGLDDLFAAIEAQYYNTGVLNNFRITQTIQEASGIISQYRFDGVAISLPDAGDWKGDAFVKQKISWKASKRLKMQ
jgi:hypothetical protein